MLYGGHSTEGAMARDAISLFLSQRQIDIVAVATDARDLVIFASGTAEERVLAQMAAAEGYVTLGDPPEALLEVLREVAPTAGW